jgi:hypothetical protein
VALGRVQRVREKCSQALHILDRFHKARKRAAWNYGLTLVAALEFPAVFENVPEAIALSPLSQFPGGIPREHHLF